MKTALLALVIPVSALLLSNCAVIPESSSSSGSSSGMSQNAQNSQNTYNVGYQMGLSDGRAGLSRTPTRYAEARGNDSDAFTSGYMKGYSEGIR